MRFSLAIINPPYGVGGNLAIKFLNKLSEHTDDIRAVLPTSVRKPSSLNKIAGHLHCDVDEDLDPSTFPGGISAVKQYWKVKNTSRFAIGVGEIPMMREHPDGCGPSGRVKTENFTHYAKGHHFIKVRDPKVVNNMVEFADKFREAAGQCNGRYHFGKNDLISTYIKCIEERDGKE